MEGARKEQANSMGYLYQLSSITSTKPLTLCGAVLSSWTGKLPRTGWISAMLSDGIRTSTVDSCPSIGAILANALRTWSLGLLSNFLGYADVNGH